MSDAEILMVSLSSFGPSAFNVSFFFFFFCFFPFYIHFMINSRTRRNRLLCALFCLENFPLNREVCKYFFRGKINRCCKNLIWFLKIFILAYFLISTTFHRFGNFIASNAILSFWKINTWPRAYRNFKHKCSNLLKRKTTWKTQCELSTTKISRWYNIKCKI